MLLFRQRQNTRIQFVHRGDDSPTCLANLAFLLQHLKSIILVARDIIERGYDVLRMVLMTDWLLMLPQH